MNYFKSLTAIVALSVLTNLAAVDIPDYEGLPDFSHPETVTNQTFVLTAQHSGSHLLLSTIQLLTNRCIRHPFTLEQFYKSPSPLYFVPVDYDYSKPTLFFTHGCPDVNRLDSKKNKLIITLRDYKENICRLIVQDLFPEPKFKTIEEGALQLLDLGALLKKEITSLGPIANAYFERLKVFDRWEPENRYLASYEDMLSDGKRVFYEVMGVLNERNEAFDLFFENEFENHRKYLLYFYRRSGRNCMTQGEDLHFFAKRISPEVLQEIDLFVKNRYPTLWEKYLHRYESMGK